MRHSKYPKWEIFKQGGDAYTKTVWYEMYHEDRIFALYIRNEKKNEEDKDNWVATLRVKQLHHYKKEWLPAKNPCVGTVEHCVKEAERRMVIIKKNQKENDDL